MQWNARSQREMRRERDTEGKKYEMKADGEEGARYKMQLGRIT